MNDMRYNTLDTWQPTLGGPVFPKRSASSFMSSSETYLKVQESSSLIATNR